MNINVNIICYHKHHETVLLCNAQLSTSPAKKQNGVTQLASSHANSCSSPSLCRTLVSGQSFSYLVSGNILYVSGKTLS